MSRHTVDESGWAAFAARHGVGDVVEGDVVEVVPFGAFVRVGAVDGFAPKPEWPALPDLGARVAARIQAIDPETRRFSLIPA